MSRKPTRLTSTTTNCTADAAAAEPLRKRRIAPATTTTAPTTTASADGAHAPAGPPPCAPVAGDAADRTEQHDASHSPRRPRWASSSRPRRRHHHRCGGRSNRHGGLAATRPRAAAPAAADACQGACQRHDEADQQAHGRHAAGDHGGTHGDTAPVRAIAQAPVQRGAQARDGSERLSAQPAPISRPPARRPAAPLTLPSVGEGRSEPPRSPLVHLRATATAAGGRTGTGDSNASQADRRSRTRCACRRRARHAAAMRRSSCAAGRAAVRRPCRGRHRCRWWRWRRPAHRRGRCRGRCSSHRRRAWLPRRRSGCAPAACCRTSRRRISTLLRSTRCAGATHGSCRRVARKTAMCSTSSTTHVTESRARSASRSGSDRRTSAPTVRVPDDGSGGGRCGPTIAAATAAFATAASVVPAAADLACSRRMRRYATVMFASDSAVRSCGGGNSAGPYAASRSARAHAGGLRAAYRARRAASRTAVRAVARRHAARNADDG